MPVGTSSSVATDVSLGWMALAKFGMTGTGAPSTLAGVSLWLVHARSVLDSTFLAMGMLVAPTSSA